MTVRVGIGGWSYEPWREMFYPATVAKKDELAYASRQVTAIEINSTFYRLQKADVFAKWRDSTPESFVFSVKAPRFVAQRRTLADAGPSVEKFLSSGVLELGAKLGPILWQLSPAQAFDAVDLEAFLKLLPHEAGSLRLRHVLEVRHRSFASAEFVALARTHRCAIAFTDDPAYPSIADATSDIIYARLRCSASHVVTGYSVEALASWAHRAQVWSNGDEPDDLPRLEKKPAASAGSREVFIYFINGAKERAPAAAMELLRQLGPQ
jgi:uncharacterized protein YecE (DUF72 family)